MTYSASAYGVGEVAGSFFFCFLPSSRAGGGGFTGAFTGGGSFFIFGANSAGGWRFGFSIDASGFVASGTGWLCFVSGVIGGAIFGAAAAGGATVSYFCLPGFSFGGFGATVGAIVPVMPGTGGTEAVGADLSRSLFLPLSRGAAGTGDVAAGTEADGVASGETFSFRLLLFFSAVIAGLTAGLMEVEAFGAGEIFSFRLFLFFVGETGGLTAGALGLATAAGLVDVAGVALAVVVAGATEERGLVAAFSGARTVGGGITFGSSFFIFSFNSVCAF